MIIDGGLSNALAARGHDLSDDLWTARLLRDAPQELAAVHRAYYDAGAEVATTASYQASVSGFQRAGASRTEALDLLRRSVTLAQRVRDDLAPDGRRRLVAASVGPYGAVLADGSEYRGRYGVPPSRLREFHQQRLEVLAAAGPDLLAVETLPDVVEAEVLLPLLEDLDVPAWVSYSVAGTSTRAGQPLQAAFEVAAGSKAVVAVGVNCCHPEDVLPALDIARSASGKPGVAYPNAGRQWDAAAHAWRGGPSYDVRMAVDWVAAGAAYVGGCCEVGPADIAALAEVLGEARPGPDAQERSEPPDRP